MEKWKDFFYDVLYATSLILLGIATGIGLCKFIYEVFGWVI